MQMSLCAAEPMRANVGSQIGLMPDVNKHLKPFYLISRSPGSDNIEILSIGQALIEITTTDYDNRYIYNHTTFLSRSCLLPIFLLFLQFISHMRAWVAVNYSTELTTRNEKILYSLLTSCLRHTACQSMVETLAVFKL